MPTSPEPDAPALALVGPWILNKGDDLMMRAVLDHCGDRRIGAPRELWPAGVPKRLVPQMLPPHAGEFRASLGRPALLARLAAKRTILQFAEARAPYWFGAAPTHGLSALLDCSGFAYGDTWSPARILQRHGYYHGLRQRGVRIVFLPQAMGPFEKPDVRNAARRLFTLGDLIYARDEDSLAYLHGLDLPEHVRLERCPDITHLLDGTPPKTPGWERRVAIVPNARMTDRTSPERAGAYLDFLVWAAEVARAEGCEPCLMIHESNDAGIVTELNARLAAPLPVHDVDAVATKGILGACRAVVASRYHALVSTLSQGIPAIGTSWTHKYDRLFEEYGHKGALLRPEVDADRLEAHLQAAIRAPSRTALVARLGAAATAQKDRVRAMWDTVDAELWQAGASGSLADRDELGRASQPRV
ncbi:polysaccharide pyruvyl transferase family protein [uncultured Jannaschia sp.]|uniref:polysaccharide pyruvyl transferase family protein n=1 Tax=uncultured Jannaschia sp. TaxID=293347 RepID=UPI00261860D7|nr:polysaccharide pyruvyl transferase family protein [uncultured Jannaschia sp.]